MTSEGIRRGFFGVDYYYEAFLIWLTAFVGARSGAFEPPKHRTSAHFAMQTSKKRAQVGSAHFVRYGGSQRADADPSWGVVLNLGQNRILDGICSGLSSRMCRFRPVIIFVRDMSAGRREEWADRLSGL